MKKETKENIINILDKIMRFKVLAIVYMILIVIVFLSMIGYEQIPNDEPYKFSDTIVPICFFLLTIFIGYLAGKDY